MAVFRTKDDGTLSEDKFEEQAAESSERMTKQKIAEEGKKIARKLKKTQLKELAAETGNDLSTIEARHKSLIEDPYSVIKELVDDQHEKDIEKKKDQIAKLEKWYMDELTENRRLKRENELLREKLETIRVNAEISTLTMKLGEWTTEESLSH